MQPCKNNPSPPRRSEPLARRPGVPGSGAGRKVSSGDRRQAAALRSCGSEGLAPGAPRGSCPSPARSCLGRFPLGRRERCREEGRGDGSRCVPVAPRPPSPSPLPASGSKKSPWRALRQAEQSRADRARVAKLLAGLHRPPSSLLHPLLPDSARGRRSLHPAGAYLQAIGRTGAETERAQAARSFRLPPHPPSAAPPAAVWAAAVLGGSPAPGPSAPISAPAGSRWLGSGLREQWTGRGVAGHRFGRAARDQAWRPRGARRGPPAPALILDSSAAPVRRERGRAGRGRRGHGRPEPRPWDRPRLALLCAGVQAPSARARWERLRLGMQSFLALGQVGARQELSGRLHIALPPDPVYMQGCCDKWLQRRLIRFLL